MHKTLFSAGKKGHKTEIDPPVLRRFDLLLPSLSMGIDWLIHHLWVIKLIGSVSTELLYRIGRNIKRRVDQNEDNKLYLLKILLQLFSVKSYVQFN